MKYQNLSITELDQTYFKKSFLSLEKFNKQINFEDYENNWIETIDTCIEENGSWETRKNYKRWHLVEVA